jgi:hypothetical protein
MEEIQAPKKERKFLKAVGNIAKVLANELIMGIGRKFIGKAINKVGNKRQGLVIAFLLVAGISYASIDSIPYPITGNKQRLGFQTTGNGLVWRGLVSDTITKPTSYVDKNVKAYLVLDSVTGSIYVWKQGAWASLVGGGSFTQPVDSLFFDTSVSPNNVDTAKMRWDYELGTVVLGMYDKVPNEIGFKNFWLVKNQTGSTITKGSLVYANGTVGASGRITVAKFIANGSIDAKYLLGITAHDLSNGEDGYVISFGKIRKVNTDTFAAGAILYPSPTVAGVWTDVEPVAPNIDMPIGFCINSHANNGTISIRVASGYALHELHDVAITSPSANASLYYSGGLWRDTTAALLISDTATMLANYATKAYADTSGRFYARQDFTNVSSSTLTWTQTDTLVVGGTGVVQVYRNGQILLPTQYTIPTNASVVIGATAYKVGENYTVIFPRGGGGGGSGGSGSLTSISGGTGILVSPDPITTTGTVSADLSVLMELTDTTLLNLTSRFAAKLNPSDTISLSNRINTKGSGTVTSIATGYGLSGGTITTSGTLLLDSATVFTRIRDSIVDVAIGNDTIKILKQEYAPALTSVLTWTVTPKFPIQLKAYILVFRNGQLLNNDQYNLTDTNQITIVSTSFKVGANYTVATVSGIGSIGTGVFPNPVYPEAGIALSTGSSWASSITNNSSNWNTAFSDRLKWDGGSTGLTASTGRSSLGGTTIGQSMFTLSNPSSITFPRFNANNSVSSLTASEFRTAIGAGVGTVTSVIVGSGTPLSINNNNTVPEISMAAASGSVNGYLSSTDWTTFNGKQNALGNASASVSGILTSTDWSTFNGKQNTLTNPVTGTGTTNTLPLFTGTSTLGNSVIQESSGNIGIGVAPTSNLELAKGKFITLNSSGSPFQDSSGIMLYEVGTKTANDINFGAKIMYNGDSDNFEIKMKNFNGTTLFNPPVSISIPRVTGNVNIGTSLAVTGAITEGGNNVLTNLDTVSLSNRIDAKLNKTDTASLSTRIDLKLNKTDTASLSSRIDGKVSLTGDQTIGGTKTFNNLVNITNQMTISGSVSGANILLGKNTSTNGVGDITVGTGLNLTGNILIATNPTERYYFNLGIVAGAADNSNATYDFTYGSNVFIIPTSLNGYCIDSVYIRAVGCSTCPPVAGDKDYYVGVYKASAGNRITTSGATLVGSQITMNEYDLNEVNRNDTLTTGDVWWVYLNGTYTSDMAYITAGFLVKKTCN